MKEYGDSRVVSQKMNQVVDCVKRFLARSNYEFSCYYKYPIPSENGKIISLPCFIVSPLGIINFCESEDDKYQFAMACMKYIYSSNSMTKKLTNGLKIIDNVDVIEYPGDYYFEQKQIILDQGDIDFFESKIQGASSIQQRDDREINKSHSIGSLIKERSAQINKFSIPQSNYINSLDLSVYHRIRGLAGSGKTIVMVKKMAFIHYQNPELKLAYVFYTISLKQYITNLFLEFFKEYTTAEPNFDNLFFLHGWGSKSNPGFYSKFCEAANLECEPYDMFDYRRSSFETVCSRALSSYAYGNLSLYDYVFIDEAQDFPKSFFDVVHISLKPNGAFSYAYDELQTLSYSTMPKKVDIVQHRECRDVNLPTCYRTPKEILVTAHALGMAIYCENEDAKKPINVPEDTDIWNATGYEHNPRTIHLGKDISFYRTEPFTTKYTPENPVVIEAFSNEEEQYKRAYDEISNLLHKEDVGTDDILIIDLKPGDIDSDFYDFRSFCYDRLNKGKTVNGDRLFDLHIVNQNDRLKFRRKHSIPFTSIFRAKGNESNIVFIFNAQILSSLMSHSRNKLFTAMTRAKFKIFVYGLSGVEEIKREAEIVKEKGYKLEFKYPTKEELKDLVKIAAKEEAEATDIVKGVDIITKLNKSASNSSLFEALKIVFGEEKARKMIEAAEDENKE